MKTLPVLRLTLPAPRIGPTLLCALTTALALSSGASQAALQGRDLDGNSVIDAYYDTDLNITWLGNARAVSPLTWSAAVTWADEYTFGGYSDWRLPTSDNCTGYNCTGSEMGHLWYVEQGNLAGVRTNSAPFINFQGNGYWSSTISPSDSTQALYFFQSIGLQSVFNRNSSLLALAVRDGDIATIPSAVPEPETYALMLAGLGALALAAKRRANKRRADNQLR